MSSMITLKRQPKEGELEELAKGSGKVTHPKVILSVLGKAAEQTLSREKLIEVVGKKIEGTTEQPANRVVGYWLKRLASLLTITEGASDPVYEASRLTFKKSAIEPLKRDESFKCIFPGGTFEATKGEFYKAFPKVVASKSYTEIGQYSYKQPPKQADPFIKKPRGSKAAAAESTEKPAEKRKPRAKKESAPAAEAPAEAPTAETPAE